MKATINKQVSNARNYSSEKELCRGMYVIGTRNGRLDEVITARFWRGRSTNASVVLCSVWVRCDPTWTSGRGSAGGGGYHKMSAALQEALNDAGITLDGDISGYGDQAMEEALEAVARAAGIEGELFIGSQS